MRKTILITGASSGLGEGLAREFAARGHDMALCARRVDRLETLAAEFFTRHPGIGMAVQSLDVTDAAMHLFRRQGHGHLVVLSSVSAVRGMPGGMATYSASKAAVAVLAEGIRNEMRAQRLPIRVTTLMPGFIHTAINAHQTHKPFAVDVATGCRALARAIAREPAIAYVPDWPWWLLARVLRWLAPSHLPGARFVAHEAT
jgi:short-subunit dehydrogenase